jgi:hypothetical protein
MKTNSIFTALITAVMFFFSGCSDEMIDKIAAAIHSRVLTVDSHVDTPLLMVYADFDPGIRHDEIGT